MGLRNQLRSVGKAELASGMRLAKGDRSGVEGVGEGHSRLVRFYWRVM